MRVRAIKSLNNAGGRRTAFTLIELLVVIAIIGILASITLPALKGFGKGNIIKGAQRQLLDDLAFARLKALSERTTVYMVFVPPEIQAEIGVMDSRNPAFKDMAGVYDNQYTSYALYTRRGVGSQPGKIDPNYLTEWRSLPDGMLFAPYKLKLPALWLETDRPPAFLFNWAPEYVEPLPRLKLRFPTAHYLPQLLEVPYIAFNSQGQLTSGRDIILPFAEGSVFYERDPQNRVIANAPADVVLTPNHNYTNNFVRINWLTGRAQIEQQELP